MCPEQRTRAPSLIAPAPSTQPAAARLRPLLTAPPAGSSPARASSLQVPPRPLQPSVPAPLTALPPRVTVSACRVLSPWHLLLLLTDVLGPGPPWVLHHPLCLPSEQVDLEQRCSLLPCQPLPTVTGLLPGRNLARSSPARGSVPCSLPGGHSRGTSSLFSNGCTCWVQLPERTSLPLPLRSTGGS